MAPRNSVAVWYTLGGNIRGVWTSIRRPSGPYISVQSDTRYDSTSVLSPVRVTTTRGTINPYDRVLSLCKTNCTRAFWVETTWDQSEGRFSQWCTGKPLKKRRRNDKSGTTWRQRIKTSTWNVFLLQKHDVIYQRRRHEVNYNNYSINTRTTSTEMHTNEATTQR